MRLQWIVLVSLVLSACRLNAGTRVQFRTTVGDFYLELYDEDKPVTVANFLRYVDEGAYENSFFHRMVPNFVIQGGLGYITNRNTTNSDLAYVATHPAITNEIHVGQFYSNLPGTIAMAKTSDPNSATSQFFINLANNSASLDATNNSGGFTVFGRILSNTNIVYGLNNFDPYGTISNRVNNIIVNAGGAFGELPVTHLRTNDTGHLYIDFEDLIYVDISMLRVAVTVTAGGGHQVSWNRTTRGVNVVEYTDALPPTWVTLTNMPAGTGTGLVTDSAPSANRFYRVRIQKP